MVSGIKILRRSLHAFFKNYHLFTSIASLILLPFSLTLLLSQSLLFIPKSPLNSAIFSRFQLIFASAGFPSKSPFFALLNSKLSQSIFSFFVTLPFALTSLLISKAYIIKIIIRPPSNPTEIQLYKSLLHTHIFNSLAILSSNAAFFSLFFLFFNTFGALSLTSNHIVFTLSALGVIFYSIFLAKTYVVCNIASVITGSEKLSGYMAIIKSIMILKGRTATAIAVSLPASLCTASIEALFQFRVMKPFKNDGKLSFGGLSEAILIGYMYSIVVVIDTIVTCMVYKSHKGSFACFDLRYYGDILERKERGLEV
ncbi:hypothetical protein LUZ60_004615 [Juncus effusus]|nr:hypothetical protein LUZ60_004615 [Juncus effusus]